LLIDSQLNRMFGAISSIPHVRKGKTRVYGVRLACGQDLNRR
jgi:hypothetical protein